MEQITQVTCVSQSKSHIPPLRLPPYFRIVLALIGGFVVMILSIRLLPQTATLPDPFASVVDIFAVQNKNDLQARGFLCSSSVPPYADSSEGWCTFNPPTGMFSSIQVKFINNDLHSRFFLVRDDALVVGDLVSLWGRPRIRQHGFRSHLDWPGNHVMAWTATYHGRYSLFLPVRSILFLHIDE
jgi:hypothetical protein